MNLPSYSLWIVPPDEIFSIFKKVIADLGAKYSSYTFEPHIGLISNITETIDVVEQKVRKLLATIPPFEVVLEKLTYYNEKPGGVYFLAEKSPDLMNVVNSLEKNIVYQKKPYFIPPHLTIAYAMLEKAEKDIVVSRYSELEGNRFKVENLYLADTTSKQGDWKIITKFNLAHEN